MIRMLKSTLCVCESVFESVCGVCVCVFASKVVRERMIEGKIVYLK